MIEMTGLTKTFGTLTAVSEVTLSVKAGEVLALLGPNGAGKTTTVRMLSSILKPTCGQSHACRIRCRSAGNRGTPAGRRPDGSARALYPDDG